MVEHTCWFNLESSFLRENTKFSIHLCVECKYCLLTNKVQVTEFLYSLGIPSSRLRIWSLLRNRWYVRSSPKTTCCVMFCSMFLLGGNLLISTGTRIVSLTIRKKCYYWHVCLCLVIGLIIQTKTKMQSKNVKATYLLATFQFPVWLRLIKMYTKLRNWVKSVPMKHFSWESVWVAFQLSKHVQEMGFAIA